MYILEGSRYEFEEVLAKSGLNIEEETWIGDFQCIFFVVFELVG